MAASPGSPTEIYVSTSKYMREPEALEVSVATEEGGRRG